MTGQLREDIGPLQGSCTGRRLYIVGSGPTLDFVDLDLLQGETIFALNAAYTLFTTHNRYPGAWWIWWDARTYNEVWPQIEPSKPKIQAILSKRGMEIMRSYRGGGRWICHGTGGPQFRPSRSVVETALLLADFLGFDEAVLLGVDGRHTFENCRPYAKALDWKPAHFMKAGKPSVSQPVFDRAFRGVLSRLQRSRVIQTSILYKPEGVIVVDDANREIRNGKKLYPRPRTSL